MMLLSEFLTLYVQGLNEANIKHCILRNYEGLPSRNYGNDIDFLVHPENADLAIEIMANIELVTITGFIRRPYVVSLFIYGVEWGEGRNAIQIDLFTSLSWKGLPYLSSEKVFSCLSDVPGTKGLLKKPAAHHEAINSFFGSYLIGGWIKEKYQLSVRSTFSDNHEAVLSDLSDFLTAKAASDLISGVVSDDRKKLLVLLPIIKCHLLWKSFSHNPFKMLKAIFIYYYNEIKIRFTSYPLDTICFLGPDGSGKSTVITSVIKNLQGTTKGISYFHLKPKLWKSEASDRLIVEDPHGKLPRSAISSMSKIAFWLFLYWKDIYFHGHKNLTLRVWDRYFYDVYIDPKRYRYGAPLWIAKLIGRFIPKPGLMIVLDAPAETIHARKQEVSLEETQRQRAVYLQFAKETPNTTVLNTDQSLELTRDDCNKAVLNYMQERQKLRMGLNDPN